MSATDPIAEATARAMDTLRAIAGPGASTVTLTLDDARTVLVAVATKAACPAFRAGWQEAIAYRDGDGVDDDRERDLAEYLAGVP